MVVLHCGSLGLPEITGTQCRQLARVREQSVRQGFFLNTGSYSTFNQNSKLPDDGKCVGECPQYTANNITVFSVSETEKNKVTGQSV